MGRPSKPAELLKSEGKSHRTKQELAFRKQQEEATLTGKKLEEPRASQRSEDRPCDLPKNAASA